MAKRIREMEWTYIAPQIRGILRPDGPEVIDELNNRKLNANDTDDKIIIYERQVKGWFLDRATRLKRGGLRNGFIILMIALSYIEGVQQYREGRPSTSCESTAFFIKRLRCIFGLENTNSEILGDFYKEVRCGLFHDGMTRGKVIISNEYEQEIEFLDRDIKINYATFLDKIKFDFKQYIHDLKNPDNTELRNNFKSMFSVL